MKKFYKYTTDGASEFIADGDIDDFLTAMRSRGISNSETLAEAVIDADFHPREPLRDGDYFCTSTGYHVWAYGEKYWHPDIDGAMARAGKLSDYCGNVQVIEVATGKLIAGSPE